MINGNPTHPTQSELDDIEESFMAKMDQVDAERIHCPSWCTVGMAEHLSIADGEEAAYHMGDNLVPDEVGMVKAEHLESWDPDHIDHPADTGVCLVPDVRGLTPAYCISTDAARQLGEALLKAVHLLEES